MYYFKVEENTAQSMKMLMEIDTVKTRMQDASRALKVHWYLLYYYNVFNPSCKMLKIKNKASVLTSDF